MTAPVVLVVEDDPDDVFFTRHAFGKAAPRLDLRVVHDGEAAQSYLEGQGRYADRHRHPLPSLVLMDVKLPKRSGLEVLEWINSHEGLQGLPVFIFSSSTEPHEVERAYQLGAEAYLHKQASIQGLTEVARGIAAYLGMRQAGKATDPQEAHIPGRV